MALSLLVEETSAREGVLFMPGEAGLVLVAPVGRTVDEDLAVDLQGIFDTARSEHASTLVPQRSGEGASLRRSGWMPIVLMAQDGSRTRGVGIAAVLRGAVPLSPASPGLVEAIARRLGSLSSADGEGSGPGSDGAETETAL